MIKLLLRNIANLMAERMGFEPMKELLLYTLSKRAPSTTRPPLQLNQSFNFFFISFTNIKLNSLVGWLSPGILFFK